MEKLYDAKKIYKIMTNILENIGVSKENSNIIASCYTEADLAGVKTHGVNIFSAHIEKFLNGTYNKEPKLKVVKEGISFKVIDGDSSIGPVARV